ncbi:MAG TPA: permease-like cell division protein FtsX [Burkholderiaceae bacterium]|nr:permease-like cell division protein FtsX [Burkholderiaceae bacterium]
MSAVATRWFALKRAVALVQGQPGSFLLNVALAGTALAVPMFLAILAYSVAPWTARIEAGPEMNVFIALGTSPSDLEQMRTKLAAIDGVTGVRLIARDQAFAELGRRSGLAAGAVPRVNPLPDVLVARFSAKVGADAVERVAVSVRAWAGVDSVRLDIEWFRRAGALARVAGIVLVVVAGLTLALIALVLVAAVRLQAESRRDETAVLHLAGARGSFIVRPYAYAGGLTLGLGAALGLAIAVGGMLLVEPRLVALAGAFGQDFPLTLPPAWLAAAIVPGAILLGLALGSIGARAAISNSMPPK